MSGRCLLPGESQQRRHQGVHGGVAGATLQGQQGGRLRAGVRGVGSCVWPRKRITDRRRCAGRLGNADYSDSSSDSSSAR